MKKHVKAFTLIELLIVVAIIAILAAIAVPNFLEAQTRAKVSRARADMRSLTTALETYVIDHNMYLYCNLPANGLRVEGRRNSRMTFEHLTTPIAYLSGIHAFTDPFPPKAMWNNAWTAQVAFQPGDIAVSKIYWYTARNNTAGANARWDEVERKGISGEPKPVWYLIESSGPDLMRHHMGQALNEIGPKDPLLGAAIYNATNGTVSRGSIWRAGGAPSAETDAAFMQLVTGSY